MRVAFRAFALVAFTLSSAACSDPNNGDAGADAHVPSFATDIQPILTTSCSVGGSTCHGSMGTGGGLQLDTAANSYAHLVNVASNQLPTVHLVEPSHPETSFLLHKLTGDMYTAVPGCSMSTQNCGQRMPMVGGVTLTDPQIEMFRQWIAAGAPNN